MKASQRRALVGGLVFVLLGVVFLLEALGAYELAPSALWPILLIVLGIVVIAGVGGTPNDGTDF